MQEVGVKRIVLYTTASIRGSELLTFDGGWRTCLSLIFIAAASPLQAHTDGTPLAPHALWTAWSLQPTVILPVAVAVAVYRRGVHL